MEEIKTLDDSNDISDEIGLYAPDDILSDYNLNTDYARIAKKLEELFGGAGVRQYSENHSISFGYHYYDKKYKQNDFLAYNITSGFFWPRTINSLITGRIITQIVNEKISKLNLPFHLNRTNHIDYVIATLNEIKNLAEVRTFLKKNICNQDISVGSYPEYRRDKQTRKIDNFHIDYRSKDFEALHSNTIFDYFVVTVCEAFFVDPFYLSDTFPYLNNFSTWMATQPTYLSLEHPIGDIFITLTYDKEKVNVNNITADGKVKKVDLKNKHIHDIIPIIFNYDFLNLLRNELHSLCRISYFENLLRKQSIKSAVASNMSRNMSHNWGSHSLVHLGNKNVLKNYQKPKQLLIIGKILEELPIIEKKGDEDGVKFYEDLAVYNNNLRIRMDLIADIVTSVPVSENTRWLYKDVLKKYVSNEIFADTISGSSVFTYKFTSNDSDIQVSIPNDILGMDAFGIIIENIVRNCAKHGNKNNSVELMFHIEDGEKFNVHEFYKISIHQDCPKEVCSDKFNCQKIVCDRRLEINTPVLDKYHQLRVGAWGILEMKIATAYLRKIPSDQIDNPEFKLELTDTGRWNNIYSNFVNGIHDYPLLLVANCCEFESCSKMKGLGYSFFLMKPKEILIFDYDEKLIDIKGTSIEKDLLNNGIKILYNEINIIKAIDKEIFNHKILLCGSIKSRWNSRKQRIRKIEVDGNVIDNSQGLPNRIVWLDLTEEKNYLLIEKLRQNNSNDFKRMVWEEWSIELISRLKKTGKVAFKINYIPFPDSDLRSDKVYSISIPGNPHSCNFTEDSPKFNYFDIDSSYSCSKLPLNGWEGIESLIKNNAKDKFCNEILSLIESVYFKVGIIDERIQYFAHNFRYSFVNKEKASDPDDILYFEYFKKMNIIIPIIDIDLADSNYSPSLKQNILDWIKKESQLLDFIFLHMGILEKLCGNTKETSIMEYFNKEILRNCKDCKVIIISGRGRPHNIPSNTRFLNYSQVAAYLCDNQSRYMLNDLCDSARKYF